MAAVFDILWIIARGVGYVAWALVRVVKFLTADPRRAAFAVATGGVLWLAWPLLPHLAHAHALLWVLGGIAGVGGLVAVARGVLDDHRYDASIQARERAEAAAGHATTTTRPAAWWEEQE